jgi:hypothetical protein
MALNDTQLRPGFLQKDRPSLVPQQAVADVRDSKPRVAYVLFMFQNVKLIFWGPTSPTKRPSPLRLMFRQRFPVVHIGRGLD